MGIIQELDDRLKALEAKAEAVIEAEISPTSLAALEARIAKLESELKLTPPPAA